MFRGPEPGASRSAEALRMVSVRRVYDTGRNPVTALDGVTLSLPAGGFTAVMGPSGSGKSTLLRCAAGLDRPTGGLVVVDGARLSGSDEAALTRFRRRRIGFVFQRFNLLPTLTALQNVALPLVLADRRVDQRRCRRALERVGLGDRLDHRPAELSGGQCQRIALARALVGDPRVVFADEPTGALDSAGAGQVLDLLRESVRRYGQTVVMATHDPLAAAHADSVLFLADGRLVGQLRRPTPGAVAERLAHLGDEVERRRAPGPGRARSFRGSTPPAAGGPPAGGPPAPGLFPAPGPSPAPSVPDPGPVGSAPARLVGRRAAHGGGGPATDGSMSAPAVTRSAPRVVG